MLFERGLLSIFTLCNKHFVLEGAFVIIDLSFCKVFFRRASTLVDLFEAKGRNTTSIIISEDTYEFS